MVDRNRCFSSSNSELYHLHVVETVAFSSSSSVRWINAPASVELNFTGSSILTISGKSFESLLETSLLLADLIKALFFAFPSFSNEYSTSQFLIWSSEIWKSLSEDQYPLQNGQRWVRGLTKPWLSLPYSDWLTDHQKLAADPQTTFWLRSRLWHFKTKLLTANSGPRVVEGQHKC